MIEHLDADGGCRQDEGPSQHFILVARLHVTVWVIRSEDHHGRLTFQRRLNYTPRVHGCPICRASFHALDTISQQPVSGIEIADFEYFVLERPDPYPPKPEQRVRLRQRIACFDLPLKIQVGRLTNDTQRHGSNRAKPLDLLQFLGRGV